MSAPVAKSGDHGYTVVEQNNIEAIRAFLASPLADRKKYFSSEFTNHRHGFEKLGPLTGTDGYSHAGIPDRGDTIEDIIAKDDRVWARWNIRGTHRGLLFGVEGTGNSIDFLEVGMWTLKDGKITEGWVMADEMTLALQLGIVPPVPHHG